MADASSFVLPASPNWYCSAVADCSLTGIYAFGARNCIYLLDVSSDTPVFAGQLVGHSERVTSVCFSKHRLHANFAASGSDDKTVKIWDVETKLSLLEHKAHSAKVTCLTWSPLATDLVISGDEKGQIIAWRYAEGNVFGACPVQEHIFSMALSYLSEGELAVGYKSGLILVLDVGGDGNISTLHRLRGHSGEIHSLSWCPTPKQHIDFGPLEEKATAAEGHLLVSGSRDQMLRLWDTEQGKVLSVIQMPKRSSQKWRDRYDSHGAKDRLWLSVCWPAASPGHIISSSHGGELLLWDLSKEGKDQHQSFGLGHTRIVFNISCGSGDRTRIMTVSMDRQIVIWDSEFLRSLHTLPTLGGFAYSLAISPLDPGTVGVGVGDNMIRVWQTSSAMGPYEAVTLWQGIKSKVMVVRWHPTKEGILAFGADDGQVGVCNVISKKVDVSSTYHKKTVYSLSWGPPCPNSGADKTALHLYSCGGEGSVLQHNTGRFMEDAADVNALIVKTNNLKHRPFGRTDVSWNLDGTLMALGNEDGSIEVYAPPDLHQLCIIITHKKSITTLAWHHGYKDVALEDNMSCKYWLASGSNESTVHIHDLGSVLPVGELSSTTLHVPTLTESFRQLCGHSGRVTGLCWSPHHSEMLLSSSYDGTAQVWDVAKGEPLHNFRGHSSRVMCVVWSYLDPDLVYSGGEDGTVRPWRPSQQQHHKPPVSEKKTGSKPSKSKKSRQKAKGKTDSTDKESWRQQWETKHGTNEAKDSQAPSSSGDLSNEVHVSPSPTQTTDTRPELGTAVTDQEHDIKSPDVSEGKEAVEAKLTQNDQSPGTTEIKEAVIQDKVNETDELARQKPLVEFVSQPEPFVPLRSRVSLETISSKKKKKVKSMFPLSAVADNRSKAVTQGECIALAKTLYGQDEKKPVNSVTDSAAPSDGPVNLGLFADRRSAYRMLDTEGQHHKESGNLDYRLQLEVWKGNLGGALQMAANSGQLSDWLVALSPLAGHDVWMTTTRAFADQLVSQGAYQRAVLYYLACHDIYRAIDVFRKQAMYREAIALAKVRLSPLDPVLSDLYCTWARKLETENSFEQAAKCYLAVHSPSEAVRVLFRRGDESSLRTALQVALLCGETELAVSLTLRLTHSFLMSYNWREAQIILRNCPGVEAHILNLCVHELLIVTLFERRVIDQDQCQESAQTEISSLRTNDTNTSELFARYSDVDVPYPNSPWLLNRETSKWFVVCVLEAWHQSGALKPDSSCAPALYQSLKSYYESISTGTDTIPEVLFKISYEITLGMLSVLNGSLYTACQYWLQSLSHCSKNCLFALQRQLCALLFPRGIESLENLLSISHELRVKKACAEPKLLVNIGQLFQHFYAYYCKALLLEIWYRYPSIMEPVAHSHVISGGSDKCDQKSSDAAKVVASEGDLLPELEPSNPEKNSSTRNVIDGACRLDNDVKSEDVNENTADVLAGVHGKQEIVCSDHNESSTSSTITPAREQEWTISFYSILLNCVVVLLSNSHANISNLRVMLAEIRKAIIVKKSKRMLLEASVSSQLNQEKKKGKKNPKAAAVTGLPLGIPAGSSQGDASSDSTSVSGASVPVACVESQDKDTALDVVSGSHSCEDMNHLKETTAPLSRGNDVDEDHTSAVEKDESAESSAINGPSPVIRAVLERRIFPIKLTTLEGQLPVELRYLTDDASLEFLTEEESRVLRELEQFDLKDLSFPSPLESAMIIGYLCARPEGLPTNKGELCQLGRDVVQWALRSAHTSADIKGLRRLGDMFKKAAIS